MTATMLARRAVTLHALGDSRAALEAIRLGLEDPEIGLEVAEGLARILLADPDAGAPITVDLPPLCAALALPVIVEVINATRGDHLGALHHLWHRLDQHVHTDVLAAMVAIVGVATRHPERN